jgi:hypothetical protein
MHLVPAHTFLAVGDIGEKLQLAVMDPQWTEEYLDSHPDALAHARTDDDRIVLTAGTSDLQAFVSSHRGSLFDDDPSALERTSPGEDN